MAIESIDPTKGRILFKHQMSCARDAMIDYEIDRSSQTVAISMESPHGKRFVSTSLLESFIVHWLPDNHGITAYDDDNNGNSWMSKRTAWKVTLKLADSVFEVNIIRQLLLNDRESFAIELDLVIPE